jgi:ABC-type transport system involved in multi-copper enzyme maturation permease subunit
MTKLIRAELLKIRRRQATYVLLIIEIVLVGLIFLTTGAVWKVSGLISFPQAYTLFQQSAFQLGGLIAIVFAAAYVGADWNWGVIRNVVARGESRERYLLAKFAALALVLLIALAIVFATCFLFIYMQSFLYNVPIANPFRNDGLQDLIVWFVLGFPVLLQRAAIGFAVAAIFRSQLAGAVVGIVLFLVEAVVTTILTVLTFGSRFVDDGGTGFDPTSGLQPVGPEWFQFLPISIGGNVFNALPGSGGLQSGDLSSVFLRPVPFPIAMGVVLVYMVVAVAIALIALRRQEIA